MDRRTNPEIKIISVLGDSVNENIFWEGDESEFILMSSDSEISFSDSSSLMIRRRNIPLVPQSKDQEKQFYDNGSAVDFSRQENRHSSRNNPEITALWESDSEIILRCESMTGIIPKANQKTDMALPYKVRQYREHVIN